jgi:hypothetical protein
MEWKQRSMVKKKVLLLVIDALASDVFFPALDKGKLPNFKALVAAGKVDRTSTAVFPSITHCALSSLATGTYPNRHGVPGGYWFDVDGEHVVYYIGDFWTILKEGVGEFFTDLLFRLNQKRIKVPTIFELVERAGHRAACINHLVHRGDVVHEVNPPLLAQLLPGVRNIDQVHGPALLFLGDLVHTELPNGGKPFTKQAGLQRRYGLDDEYSADLLLHLACQRALPDLTVAYFMDNDYRSHEVGPARAQPVLEKLDGWLGELFERYGGLEALLAEFAIVITGDHSQSVVAADEQAAIIDLGSVLKEFRLSPIGQNWQSAEDVVACPNMRALQLYFAQPEAVDFEAVAQALLADERVDQVLWRARWQHDAAQPQSALPTTAPPKGYIVLTKERGRLRFWPSDELPWLTPNHGRDEWGQRWQWEGDLSAVDAECYRRKLRFGDYPNAFERIACALIAENGGHMWATAFPGAEFQLESSLVHVGGGSHGSLHRLDSTMPLVVAGAPKRFKMPESSRTVDVLPLCLSILGVSAPHSPGSSHISDDMLQA